MKCSCGWNGSPLASFEAEEAGIVLVAVRVQGLREDVLAEVVRQLLLVGEIAVARVEALRKQQQGPDPIAALRELRRMGEFVGVPLGVISPDVLDLEPVAAFRDILGEVRPADPANLLRGSRERRTGPMRTRPRSADG